MSKYTNYVGLPHLLEIGFEALPDAAGASAKADELHFKRLHQESELSLAQMLVDLEATVDLLKLQRDLGKATFHLTRAAAIVEGMQTKLSLLRPPYFTAERFEAFRDLLAPASGAHSPGFTEVRRALGLEGNESPVFKEFKNSMEEQEVTLATVIRSPEEPLYLVAQALLRVAMAYEHWLWDHLQNARLVVGIGRQGTGGSDDGAAFLRSRVVAPFPELWEAVGKISSD
ncbi:dioxygenase [Streptomyces sp. NPDC060027]|uniref:dioxygenase n=1 Tax=Streptomyces sp. NPDC060027 TaxID=3347040 RepID=UPI0036B85FE7